MQFKAVKANIDIRITSLIDMVNSSEGHELEFSKMSRAQNLLSQVRLELKINGEINKRGHFIRFKLFQVATFICYRC